MFSRRGTDAESSGTDRPRTRRFVRPLALATSLALITAGMLVLERASAAASPATHVVRASHGSAAPSAVSSQVAALTSGAGKLQTISEMLTSNKASFDAHAAVNAAAVASSASQAATASRNLAAIAQTANANSAAASAANAAATALKSSLSATRAGAAALAARPAIGAIAFCRVTFTAFGGLTIVIPGIITIVIPPVIITINVPCFLSGIFHR
jgi:hypothetical protein